MTEHYCDYVKGHVLLIYTGICSMHRCCYNAECKHKPENVRKGE